ncbi:N-acetylmuramidase domain-containing protein [Paracoccus rhizosphaerae]|uniref:N-acetylmuramidase domain-containing protein n=1 Tax=Paracoccus rhizosphaerae TaxID=1133347 RepID=A0ABV6CN94_9RHOB
MISAVIKVETAAGGFVRYGRPRMLFESYVFWRELGAGSKRERAEAQVWHAAGGVQPAIPPTAMPACAAP